jgi:hypothetical protein
MVTAVGCLAAVGAVGNLFASQPESPPPALPRAETPEGLPDYMADPGAASRRVEQMTRRTRGDYTRLTERERNWINGMTAGYGHELLWNQARLLGIEPKGAPPPDRGGAPRASPGP